MTDAPDPLVPADLDLRDFQFMPIDIRRLLTSETWLTGSGEERAAAMALWCESWHQVPAASLPDNDRMLAHLSQAGNRWAKVKAHVLRSWIKCSDGRLYHPVVAEKALKALDQKRGKGGRGSAGARAKWGTKPDPQAVEQRRTRSERLAEARKLGKHTAAEWAALCDIFSNTCVRCGASGGVPVKDHIVPIYQGGSDALSNLQPLCPSCNSSKGSDATDHRSERLHNWLERLQERLQAEENACEMPARTPAKRLRMPGNREGEGDREGESKNLNPESSQSPIRALRAPADQLAFFGKVIRLTQADFDRWKASFSAIPDLRAELECIDAKFVDEGFSGKWFGRASGWLRARHEELLKHQTSEDDLYRGIL